MRQHLHGRVWIVVLSDDHVYSISTAGYKINPLRDLETTVNEGSFGETDLCTYGPMGGGMGGGEGGMVDEGWAE